MARKPKFKIGDIVESGPFVTREDGGRVAADPAKAYTLSKLSEKYGPFMIVAKVITADKDGIRVEPLYLRWAKHITPAEDHGSGITYLPADSDDYKITRLYDREADNTDTMIEFLVSTVPPPGSEGKDKP